MRKLLQKLLKRPVLWASGYFAAAPRRDLVFKSLTGLLGSGGNLINKKLQVVEADLEQAKFIIFSDQHKGNKSWADDFAGCEKNYVAALSYYNQAGYHFINMGDSEELWKFGIHEILPQNENAFLAEAAFQPGRYYKTFGNHDVLWKNPLDIALNLVKYFTMPLYAYEGILIKGETPGGPLSVFLTHGHQGDKMSDNNAVSTWLVSHLWMPLQRYLRININTPSNDHFLRNRHNQIMYEWSSQQENLILITGHTHQPVFASGRYYQHKPSEFDAVQIPEHRDPTYYNTGCCCFSDGDITGIEISGGKIRLVKWTHEEINPERMILEEQDLSIIMNDMKKKLPS